MFAGTCTEVHHQCFRMVDLLINYFEQEHKTLNPCAAPCVPNGVEEVKETSKNDVEMNELDEIKCAWKIPRETRVKRNMTGKASNAPIKLKHMNACSSLEDEEEEDEEKSNKEG